MENAVVAQSASEFLSEFKAQLLHEIHELNCRNDGELQDGFNPSSIDDGWVSLKGFAWGFVMHFDDPVRMDMRVGPDWPTTGYRTTFVAVDSKFGLMWVNQDRPEQIYFTAEQLIRYGLQSLTAKVGDEWVLRSDVTHPVMIEHNPFYGVDLTARRS